MRLALGRNKSLRSHLLLRLVRLSLPLYGHELPSVGRSLPLHLFMLQLMLVLLLLVLQLLLRVQLLLRRRPTRHPLWDVLVLLVLRVVLYRGVSAHSVLADCPHTVLCGLRVHALMLLLLLLCPVRMHRPVLLRHGLR